MKRNLTFLMLSFLLVVGLAACGGAGEEEDSTNGGEETEQNENAENGDGTVDVAAAEKSFNQACASCHGENLKGASGPALDKIGAEMSQEEILAQIKNGGGGMPGGLLEGEEAENVAAWLASMK